MRRRRWAAIFSLPLTGENLSQHAADLVKVTFCGLRVVVADLRGRIVVVVCARAAGELSSQSFHAILPHRVPPRTAANRRIAKRVEHTRYSI